MKAFGDPPLAGGHCVEPSFLGSNTVANTYYPNKVLIRRIQSFRSTNQIQSQVIPNVYWSQKSRTIIQRARFYNIYALEDEDAENPQIMQENKLELKSLKTPQMPAEIPSVQKFLNYLLPLFQALRVT